jgi:SAM-dependent methyltransferase
MKICNDCGHQFEANTWQCAMCGYQPEMHDEFPFFAPQLIKNQHGFDARFFHDLARIEKGNFWFESRNRLLIWALKRHFPKARHFLEIGCGTGFVLAGIRPEFPGLVLSGSDLYIEGLRYARQRIPQATLLQMDARNIPFENEFDVIGAFDVLEHIVEDKDVLEQMGKAVRHDGGIILTVPQHPFMWSQADDYSHHVRRYTAKDLKVKVRDAGFEVLKISSFVSLLFPLMLVSRIIDRHSETYDPASEVKLNHFMNTLFTKVLEIERWFIKLGLLLPFGGSLMLVAHKLPK